MKGILLSIFFGVFVMKVEAQSSSDTLNEPHITSEVIVSDSPWTKDSSGVMEQVWLQKERTFLSTDLATYMDRKGLGTVLVNGAPGSAASLRSRGTSSDHSVFCWNGVPLNSVSLGTCDLSLIPVFLFDVGSFYPQTNNTSLASSGLGMTVNLNNHEAVGSSHISLLSSYNSLLNSFQGLDMNWVIGKERSKFKSKAGVWEFRTKAFMQDLRNEFSYVDKYDVEHPVVKQNHNNGRNNAWLQDVSWKKDRWTLSGHFWWQQKDVHLPSIMGKQGESNAEQNDALKRTLLKAKYRGEKSEFEIASAWMNEFLRFRDLLSASGEWGIDSKMTSRVSFTTMKYVWKANEKISLEANSFYTDQHVLNSNYESGQRRIQWAQATAGINYIQGRHEFHSDARMDKREISSRPMWSAGWRGTWGISTWKLIPSVLVSRKFRLPDMNELYWYPGGNPELKPEQGMSYKAGVEVHSADKNSMQLKMQPSVFYNEIKDWIQWIPGSSGVWSPVNFKLVRNFGWEIPMQVSWKTANSLLQAETKWTHLRSLWINGTEWNREVAKDMIYTPTHVWTSDLKYVRSFWTVGIQHKYTSARFTEEQNLDYRSLSAYHLMSCRGGITLNAEDITTSIDVSVDNLFNVQYESVRAYAMPGRVFQINVKLFFKIKTHE